MENIKSIVITKFRVIEFCNTTHIVSLAGDVTNILKLLPVGLKALLTSIQITKKGLVVFKFSCRRTQFESIIGILSAEEHEIIAA